MLDMIHRGCKTPVGVWNHPVRPTRGQRVSEGDITKLHSKCPDCEQPVAMTDDWMEFKEKENALQS